MKVSNRNFCQVLEGAEHRMQLHHKGLAAELGWSRTHNLVLVVHPPLSKHPSVALCSQEGGLARWVCCGGTAGVASPTASLPC